MRSYKFLGETPSLKVGETVKLSKDMPASSSPLLGSYSQIVIPKGTSFKVVNQVWSTMDYMPIYDVQNDSLKVSSVPETWLEG